MVLVLCRESRIAIFKVCYDVSIRLHIFTPLVAHTTYLAGDLVREIGSQR